MTQDNLSVHKIESVNIFNFFFLCVDSTLVVYVDQTKPCTPFSGIHLQRSFVVASIAVFIPC